MSHKDAIQCLVHASSFAELLVCLSSKAANSSRGVGLDFVLRGLRLRRSPGVSYTKILAYRVAGLHGSSL